jgi:hypothetical protein
MDLKEIIRRAVSRSIRKAGNRYGETLKIELPAVELIADEITREMMDVIGMYTHNGDEEIEAGNAASVLKTAGRQSRAAVRK